MIFNFTVRGDKITPDEEYVFTEGNKGSYEAIFDFGEEWNELAKLCIVRCGDKKYSIPIFGNSCLLPELSKSSAKIGVVGVDALDEELVTRISTNMRGIGVQSGAYDEETAQKLNTAAEVWEQYLTEMEASRKAAETAKLAAQAASGASASAKEEAQGYAALARQKAEEAKKAEENIKGLSATATEGDTVSVTQTMTDEGIRLDFTLPRGPKGENGADGKDGQNGADGKDGAKGEKGDKGDRGEQGIQGKQGPKGDKGDKPIRGTDYWTEADKDEIKAYVEEAILGGAW